MDGVTKDLQLKETLLSKNWRSESLCPKMSNYYPPKRDIQINFNSNEIAMKKVSFENTCAVILPLHYEFVNYE